MIGACWTAALIRTLIARYTQDNRIALGAQVVVVGFTIHPVAFICSCQLVIGGAYLAPCLPTVEIRRIGSCHQTILTAAKRKAPKKT